MKTKHNHIATLALLLALVLAVSCAEDRTYEYEAKTASAHWLETTMREQYLWGDSLKDLSWTEYFSTPVTFFAKLTAQAPITDSWSWCSIDTLDDSHYSIGHFNRFDTYGLDFSIVTDPTGQTNRQMALITQVFADSPATECGLTRGDYITHVGTSRISSSTTSYLESGNVRTLTVCHLALDTTGAAYTWSDTTTLQLPASRAVRLPAFSSVSTFDTSEGTLAYITCNRLAQHDLPTSTSDASSIRQQTLDAMQSVRDAGADILIVDLRNCLEGTIEGARTLASHLVSSDRLDDTFAQTYYRTDRASLNASWTFDATITPLHLKYVFFITSSRTSGAAEWMMRSISYAMPADYIYHVGATTAGQIVVTDDIATPYSATLHPAVAYVADGSGSYDYASGLTPDLEVDDASERLLAPFGTIDEPLLAAILAEFQ